MGRAVSLGFVADESVGAKEKGKQASPSLGLPSQTQCLARPTIKCSEEIGGKTDTEVPSKQGETTSAFCSMFLSSPIHYSFVSPCPESRLILVSYRLPAPWVMRTSLSFHISSLHRLAHPGDISIALYIFIPPAKSTRE